MSWRWTSGKRRTSTRRGLKGPWSGRISLEDVRIDRHRSVTQNGEQGPSETKTGRIRPSTKSPPPVPRLPLGKVQEVVNGRVQAMGDPDRAGSGLAPHRRLHPRLALAGERSLASPHGASASRGPSEARSQPCGLVGGAGWGVTSRTLEPVRQLRAPFALVRQLCDEQRERLGVPGGPVGVRARSLRGLLVLLLGDGLVIVGRVEVGTVGAPGFLLDYPVYLAQALRRESQGHHLPDPHHHVPGNDLDAGGRERFHETGPLQLGADLRKRLGLVVAEKDRQQDLPAILLLLWSSGGRNEQEQHKSETCGHVALPGPRSLPGGSADAAGTSLSGPWYFAGGTAQVPPHFYCPDPPIREPGDELRDRLNRSSTRICSSGARRRTNCRRQSWLAAARSAADCP